MKLRKCVYSKAKRSNSQDDWEAYTLLQNKEFYKYNTERGTQYVLQKADYLITPLVVTVNNFGGTSELNVKTSTIFLHYS